ncbi:heparinase II/III family protein [Enterovirga aerilata]|uniref:Heparinase n=1 Tax=Enterovirga aerilata TaxID=2730920 RepID=A0A849I4Z7_9HYPH|nr:heparinase II/III family protein [Enterovirga sp. DB1703]NNM71127.1 heparinase [Enterovirga sp. DB1703]
MGWAADRWRLYRLALAEAGRVPILWLRRHARGPSWRVPRPERLLFAPQDLRTSDPTIAQDIYSGLFTFAGREVETRGRSPFEIEPPTRDWARALYGFSWLRHLRAADSQLSRENARALVGEAVGPRRRELAAGVGREPRVVARRTISFLCQSPLVLNGADPAFYNAFLRAIGRGVALLEAEAVGARIPLDRLAAAIALSYAALCCSGLENRLRRATRLLGAELDAQILPDGGHVSRHPGVLIELLLDLLPLRLLYASRAIEAPEALGRAIDRMMPMLRYLRGGGRELALFNGMGPTAVDQIATLLSYDSVRGSPPSYAEQSGYARLESGGTVLIADTGRAPPLDSAGAAHAGCLSFEMTAGGAPLVVNVGAPLAPGPARTAARRTAAHSTLALGEVSSGLLLEDARGEIARFVERRLGPVLVAGPGEVRVERGIDADGWVVVSARHDGYEARFGIAHERRWSLAPDGARLEGVDRLLGAGRPRERAPGPVLRFHLHPDVQAAREASPNAVALKLGRSGEVWRFRSENAPAALEDSIYFGGPQGRRPTRQIVVRLNPPPPDAPLSARWSFERVLEGRQAAAPPEEATLEEPEAPAGRPGPEPDQS